MLIKTTLAAIVLSRIYAAIRSELFVRLLDKRNNNEKK